MDQPPARSTRCTAACADGSPCRAWAVHGTDPPRCAPHGGGESPVGTPLGNQNALKHGFYARVEVPENGGTIERAIAELATRQARLSRYIDGLLEDDDLDLGEVARVMQLYGRAASRLVFLLTYQKTFERVAERLGGETWRRSAERRRGPASP